VIRLPFCHSGLVFEPGFLPVWWVALPSLVPVPLHVPLCDWGPHPNSLGGWVSPPDQTAHWQAPSRITFPSSLGSTPSDKGGEKKNGLWVPNEPPEMLWDSWTERGHWGSSTGNNILLCRHRLSGLLSKDWASRTKCFALYTLSSTVQKWETKLNPYMVVCYFYWLLYPQYYITLFRSSFLKFQFAAMLSPPPHYILSWCHV
jgi:hypothetical protein